MAAAGSSSATVTEWCHYAVDVAMPELGAEGHCRHRSFGERSPSEGEVEQDEFSKGSRRMHSERGPPFLRRPYIAGGFELLTVRARERDQRFVRQSLASITTG